MSASQQLPVKQKLAAMRGWACQRAPYFSHAIHMMVSREVPDGTISENGTFRVTQEWIWEWEPAAVKRWSIAEGGSVVIHEVMHLLRHHGDRAIRAAVKHHKMWNWAADAEINDDLHRMKLPLPDNGGVTAKSINEYAAVAGVKLGLVDGRTAEEYYRAMDRAFPDPPPELLALAGPGCGSCATHAPANNEPQNDPKARSEAEHQIAQMQTALAILEHVKQKGIGSAPASMVKWAEEHVKPPKVPWNQKLSVVARATVGFRPGAVDFTYTRISRRQAGVGFGTGSPRIPAMVGRQPRIAIGVDTSGSMGPEETQLAVNESAAIMRSIGSAVDFLACDCAIHAITKVRNVKELLAHLKGGGGTDFHPVFEAIGKMKPPPEVLVFITDGGGYAPRDPIPGVKIIWLLVGKHRMKPMQPRGGSVTYGEFIEVD